MFKRAERKKAKLRLAICGPSGSGKTYSALLIAQGLGGPIAFIDSERGSGSLYSNLCEYDVADLEPPYTPQKYIAALKEAELAGYNVVIIDSLTHPWAGQGGLLEEVDKRKGKGNDFTAWREITPQHNALVDAILQARCHVIATMRSKTAYDMVKDERTGKVKPVKVGLAPVQRDGMEYEFTTVLDIDVERHMATSSKDRTGLFDGKVFVPDQQTGRDLLTWLESGVDDPLVKLYDISAIQSAMGQAQTVAALTDYLRSLAVPEGHKQRADIASLYHTRKAQLDFIPEVPAVPQRQPDPITDDQRKYIQAAYNGWDREKRLAHIGEFIGRVIASVNDMTKEEASLLIDAMESEKQEAANA